MGRDYSSQTLTSASDDTEAADYLLDGQIGFVLRVASQRHGAIFSGKMLAGLTPTRFAVLAKLYERGPQPQNELGRLTAMDVATIKGVVDRLRSRGLVATGRDPHDGRKMIIELTGDGKAAFKDSVERAKRITKETLKPLDPAEQSELLRLLRKIT